MIFELCWYRYFNGKRNKDLKLIYNVEIINKIKEW